MQDITMAVTRVEKAVAKEYANVASTGLTFQQVAAAYGALVERGVVVLAEARESGNPIAKEEVLGVLERELAASEDPRIGVLSEALNKRRAAEYQDTFQRAVDNGVNPVEVLMAMHSLSRERAEEVEAMVRAAATTDGGSDADTEQQDESGQAPEDAA